MMNQEEVWISHVDAEAEQDLAVIGPVVRERPDAESRPTVIVLVHLTGGAATIDLELLPADAAELGAALMRQSERAVHLAP